MSTDTQTSAWNPRKSCLRDKIIENIQQYAKKMKILYLVRACGCHQLKTMIFNFKCRTRSN